jgi:O-antigen/teichoic acid export membrane protein
MNGIKTKISAVFGFLNRNDGSLRNKILRSGFWQGLTTIGVNSLTLIKSMVLARILSPEAFGLMSLALMTIRGAQLLTDTGFGTALIQRKGDFDEAKDTAFTLLAIRGLLLALLMLPVAYFMAGFYEKPQLLALIAVCGLSFVVSGFTNISLTAAIRDLDFKKIAIIENSAAVTSFVVALVIALWFRSVWALVISFIVSGAVKLVLSYVIIEGRPKFQIEIPIAKELLHYGKYITGSTILLFIATEIDTAVIGKVLDIEKLGHYSVAFMLANFPATHVAFVISNIMFPAYSKIQGEPELLRATFCKVTELVSSLVVPVMTGMAVAADVLINVLYGEKWMDAIPPFRILCIFGAIHSVVTVNGYMFNAIGRPDVGLKIALLRLSGIAALILPAIQYSGVVGAAWAMTFVMFLSLLYGLWQVRKILSVPVIDTARSLFPAVVKSFAVGLGILLAARLLPEKNVASLLLLILVGALIYLPLNFRLAKMVLRSR